MRARSMVLACACVVMLLCGLAEAVPLRLDLGIGPVSSGWTGVHSEKRFDKARNDPSAAAKTVIDIDGDGKTEEIYAGYNAWAQGFERDRGSDPACTNWPAPYAEVLRDFSGPVRPSGIFTVWNLPEGKYRVTVYMRDWQYGYGTYTLTAHDGTLFEVVHVGFICLELDSVCDTHVLHTAVTDPDGSGANYDARPSLWFTTPATSPDSSVCGYEIEWVPPPGGVVLLIR